MTQQPRRQELTDEQWAKLEQLLPLQKPRTGRPNKDHRLVLNGILRILHTGAQWADLPERYGSPKTVSSRLYRWRKAGVWDRVLAELQRQGDQVGAIQWDVHYVDGTVVRAHQSAAGAKRGTPKRLLRRRKPWGGAEAVLDEDPRALRGPGKTGDVCPHAWPAE